MATRHDNYIRNPYNCSVTLLAPNGKRRALSRIVASLMDWVDPSRQIIRVSESSKEADANISIKHSLKVNGCLISPAISVMLFMKETGKMCVKDVQRMLRMLPFQFHHKVELQNKSSPKTSLAKQEFYKLSDDLPLFAACPVLSENEHLRINIYVLNFPAMVEFYRLITDTEIETNKPEFCIFELYRQPGLDIQLSLKRSQYIHPAQVGSAYVSFNIKSIDMIKAGSNCTITHIIDNVYTTHDPDGNLVVLYDISLQHSTALTYLASAISQTSMSASYCSGIESLTGFDDVKSLKSTTESHDSGRYSDTDLALVNSVLTTSY